MESRTATLGAEEYHLFPALSNSGMKDLAVSPLRYWYKWIRPDREAEEPTPEMCFGSALHCAVLEPTKFDERYAREAEVPDGCLVTIDDLRQWLRDKGHTPKGTRKADVIAQVMMADPNAPIMEIIEHAHAVANEGKIIFKADEWVRLAGCAKALAEEPRFAAMLSEGQSEVSMFAADKDTGVPLKARLDWVKASMTVDIKTFAQKRGKSIDKSITDAMLYEGYLRQGVFYSMLRGWPDSWNGEFVFAFVESDPPHEVRLRSMRPKLGGQPNLHWMTPLMEIRGLIRLCAECIEKFGDKPWKSPREITPLADEEMPSLIY